MNILYALLNNRGKLLTPNEWADVFGVIIYDADGWTRETFRLPCSLTEFLDRIGVCTITGKLS